ncbi:hypothetical protein CVT25_008572 [Psilocybe cyanescens]|uniref:Uncharacterized protein n=1 Tax=Psilocybe cyanescens TaxID=93625 RepID=A0A409XNF8_PSICY|nr:hypothetical protein CVT25_008572 [Psilocybe cyanescens]
MPHVAISSAWAITTILLARFTSAQYSATYLPSNVPAQTEQGQAGTNQCGTALNQTSECQNAYINSVTDFCVFAPPNPGPGSVIGNTESGTGARLIPDGAIKGAHFVQTPDFVQVTGNPIGGLVFSSAFGQLEQIHEWTNFVAADEFCFRACKPGPLAATFCQHIYDVMGCAWNMPANYGEGFENCQADSGQPMGVYGSSTFHQGEPVTPSAHPIPPSSSCTPFTTIGNGFVISGTSISASVTSTFSPPSATSTVSGAASSSTAISSASAQGSKSGSNSASNSGTSPAATSTTASSSAIRAARIDGWDRLLVNLGLAVVASTLGAVLVL